jgi:hypothetical protein
LAVEIPKTRRRTKAVSEAADVWTKEFLSGAIQTIVSINVALKPKELQELWVVSDDEIKSIVEPLDKWLKSMNPEVLAKVSKYAYPALTIMATGAVIIPRTMIETAYINEKKRALKAQKMQQDVVHSNTSGASNGAPSDNIAFHSEVKTKAYTETEGAL